ncbi:flagella basal body P-ring formation protein FlgA [Cellvibrio zantedeschiae]|uniref:Flagella basal body P-ring formation protein FlgA n=1 Tax=Cellvibrio zantedeschiae TaxID=1237077 RepID=A0ABQ3AZY4_9GAMM|nr:flagellar basal body P-ring formation chaperone FlgA [Cellvibrio zantedeschiae]GGY72507.1 flagella basal body P-ring formation protein FlgA [Cellvibrio zantedeschiae]
MRFRSFYRIFFLNIAFTPIKQGINRITWFCALAVCFSQSANAQAPIENIGQIELQVARFLTDEYSKTQAIKVEVKVGNLDNRLRLARCDQSLSLNLKDTTNSGGNINVQVACKGTSSWTILVPAQAKVYRSVAVASRTLQRGDVVTEDDLTTEVKDVSEFRMGFSLVPNAIVGKEIKFTVNKGEVFRNSALDAPLVIKRGDTVSMEAAAGEISVKTNGTAVSDGRIGQQIRVKNNQSARVINARVVAAGKVQSIM